MSLEAITAVWSEKRQINPGPQMVLLALADFAWPTGWAFPSVATIAKKARMSERHCVKLIRWLEENEFLMVLPNQGWNGSNLYAITAVCKGQFDPPTPDEIWHAMQHKTVPSGHKKRRLQPPCHHDTPLSKRQGVTDLSQMPPKPEETNNNNNGASEWPTEQEVLAYAKEYQGSLAKGIPAVIPARWASWWWGYQTHEARKFSADWKAQMAWRFEGQWQDGNEQARGESPKKNYPAPASAAVEELTFQKMRQCSE